MNIFEIIHLYEPQPFILKSKGKKRIAVSSGIVEHPQPASRSSHGAFIRIQHPDGRVIQSFSSLKGKIMIKIIEPNLLQDTNSEYWTPLTVQAG
ncbi:hypothetical protein SUGI_1140800 [Cryptomeria japonica]|nr:hypothetical protein SUGI_1140800 [Cryptomeria japonica]